MIKDTKVPIIYGLLGVFQDDAGFFELDGKNWISRYGDLVAHLTKIKNAGADGVRIFAGPVWGGHKYGKRSQFQPYLLDEKADAWNLDSWNTYFFPRLKTTIEIINDLNMTVLLPWFENCQFHGAYKRWSCWANNVQGIGSFYEPKADQYSKNWMFTLYNRYYGKYDVIFPFGNENENKDFPDMANRVILPFVKKYGLDFKRLTYGATVKLPITDSNQFKVRLLVRKQFGSSIEKKILMEDHGYPFTASLPKWAGDYRGICSDDGLHPRPSPSAWAAKAKFIVTHYPKNTPWIEHLPETHPIDLALDVATIKAIKKVCEGA